MAKSCQVLGSYWTLAVGAEPAGDRLCSHDFRVRVETAARAGFTAMGFWHTDIAAIRRKYSFADMRSILQDNGITQVEVEWLLEWYCTDHRRVTSDQTRQLLLDAAEALQARQIKVSDLDNDCASLEQMAEEFRLLCREAADRGTNVLFEMLPPGFSRAASLEQVVALCHQAGEKNGGIMLDIHHLQRAGTAFEHILRKIAPGTPLGVEINDGPLAMPVNLRDAVINRRLLPGDGEWDITAFLHATWTHGYDGPIGVEALNEYIRKWPLEAAAAEAFAKTVRVVTAAREKWEALHEGAQ